MRKNYFKKVVGLFAFIALGATSAYAQQTYTFTTGGATGNTGPTQPMLDAAYASTSLDGDVTSNGGIQYWVVPATGNYQIETWGGQGYGAFGGRGAYMSGNFTLFAGDTLKILVGQMAGPYLDFPLTTYNHQFGGGGGSFVTTINNTPLVIAGGGGGNHGTVYDTSCDGQIGTSGSSGVNGATLGAGGTAGNGGFQGSSADGGGGLLGNGDGLAAGQAFVNGGLGGIDEGTGGFGCGGGTSSWNNYRGGGGGGYSGGGGGNNGGTCCPGGGGGGSFNAGLNQIATAGVQIGDGSVIISNLQTFPNDGGIAQIAGFVAPVCTGTYPVDVLIQNYGNNAISPITVEWTLNGAAQTNYVYTSVLDTVGGAGQDSAWVNIGNVSITEATTIQVWTSMPNGLNDSTNYNDTMTIFIAAPAVVEVATTLNLCNGDSNGSLTALPSGGTPGYVTVWSTGDSTLTIDSLMAGNYTVYIEDMDGCSDSLVVSLDDPTPLSAVDSTSDMSCNGVYDGQITLFPQGGTPGYSNVWSTTDSTMSINSLAAGNYSFEITDSNGCVFSDIITINEPTLLNLSATAIDESIGNDGSVDLTVTGGTPNYTYDWSNGATTEDITGIAGGNYTVIVTDANGCLDSIEVYVDGLSLNELKDLNINIYPNPTNGIFYLAPSTMLNAKGNVVDALGRVVFDLSIESAETTTIDLSGNESGIYFLNLTVDGVNYTQRLILR